MWWCTEGYEKQRDFCPNPTMESRSDLDIHLSPLQGEGRSSSGLWCQIFFLSHHYTNKRQKRQQLLCSAMTTVEGWPSRSNRKTMHKGFSFLLSEKKKRKERQKHHTGNRITWQQVGKNCLPTIAVVEDTSKQEGARNFWHRKALLGCQFQSPQLWYFTEAGWLLCPHLCAQPKVPNSLQVVTLHLNITFICC